MLQPRKGVMVGVQVHRRWFVAVGLVVVCCVAAFAALAASGSSAVAVNGRIAWKSFAQVDGTWSIYAANSNGSNPRRLTHPGVGIHDDLPDWSPDGSTIVFERIFQPGTDSPTVADEVMRLNADGT